MGLTMENEKKFTREQLLYWLISRNAIKSLRFHLYGTTNYAKGRVTRRTVLPLYRKMNDEQLLQEANERVAHYKALYDWHDFNLKNHIYDSQPILPLGNNEGWERICPCCERITLRYCNNETKPWNHYEITMKNKENSAIGYKQMVVNMDPALLTDIKSRALFKNITLKKWVLQAILEKIAQEDKAK
jgi:hypothetical protein